MGSSINYCRTIDGFTFRPACAAPVMQGLAPARLRRVLDFIDDRLDNDITIKALAQTACLSPFHFARAFKVAVGRPPHRYVHEKRIERAKALLIGSDQPLAEIALCCGFSSQSNFSRAFRQATGTAPGRYRATKRMIASRSPSSGSTRGTRARRARPCPKKTLARLARPQAEATVKGAAEGAFRLVADLVCDRCERKGGGG